MPWIESSVSFRNFALRIRTCIKRTILLQSGYKAGSERLETPANQGFAGWDIVVKDDHREERESGPLSKELRAALGNNFREARTRMGLSQQQVAAATGITQGRIARIELGQVNVTVETITRIARVVDSDPLHLLRSPNSSAS